MRKKILIFLVYPVQTSIKPAACKSNLGPAIINNPSGEAVLSAVPTKSSHQASLAGRLTIQMISDREAVKGAEMSVEKEEQDLAVTPESVTSSCMESDSTFISDEYEEDSYSSASPDSCSLPSPEVFRKETSGVCMCFCAWIFFKKQTNKPTTSI